jgi:protein ImuA
MRTAPSSTVQAWLHHPDVWRAADSATNLPAGLPTGFAELDQALPGGGWPVGDITELLCDISGHGEVSLLLPMLSACSRKDGWIAWVAPPARPHIPALAAAGIVTTRLLMVQAGSAGEQVWALRQALEADACTAVVGWLHDADMAALRRLHLAVRNTCVPLMLFRPASAAHAASPAVLRLRLGAGEKGSLQVDILKRRGRPMEGPLNLFTRGTASAVSTASPPLSRWQEQSGAWHHPLCA